MHSSRVQRSRAVRRGALAVAALAGSLLVMQSQSLSCTQSDRHAVPREPDVPYEPSPPHVVDAMLELADVRPGDVVFDLGCGDGRIVIAAVKKHGARATCVDIDPVRIRESRENAETAGVADQITFLTQDLFETDLSQADVTMLFLWPKVNLKLRPKLQRELQPGSRIVSHMHDMGDWMPDATIDVSVDGKPRTIYRWTTP